MKPSPQPNSQTAMIDADKAGRSCGRTPNPNAPKPANRMIATSVSVRSSSRASRHDHVKGAHQRQLQQREVARDGVGHVAAGVDEQMIRDNSGIIKYEELVADRRPATHQHREHQRQHQDVQDRLEQCPAVSELRVAETGAGFADDQGVNDARLGLQRCEHSRLRSQPPRRPQCALAQHDIFAVERFEPAVQYLEHRLGVFFIVGRGSDQLAADASAS